MKSTITGWGKCVPDNVVTNDDMATFIDTSDEWIQQRTGIKERRFSHVNNSDMASVAGLRAIATAGLQPEDIDSYEAGYQHYFGENLFSLETYYRVTNDKIENIRSVYPDTALENVTLPLIYAGIGKNERIELATKTLAEVGLADRMDHRPNELSGGQRQRVAVARALVNNPSIILADEPTGNLDSVTGSVIMEIIKELNRKGTSLILVTHDKEIGSWTKKILILKDGTFI